MPEASTIANCTVCVCRTVPYNILKGKKDLYMSYNSSNALQRLLQNYEVFCAQTSSLSSALQVGWGAD